MNALLKPDATSSNSIGRIRSRVSCRHEVEIWTSAARLAAYVELPRDARGLVIVANGDGDHVWAAANARIATVLAERGFATLVVDLLTPTEAAEDAETSSLRFDPAFLGARLDDVTRWASARPGFQRLPIAYLTSGLCANAALAAASISDEVNAVICRAAHVQLDAIRLERIKAPVLLLVGDLDVAHIQSNRDLVRRLRCDAHFGLIRAATHMMDDPRSTAFIARAVDAWFDQLRRPAALAS